MKRLMWDMDGDQIRAQYTGGRLKFTQLGEALAIRLCSVPTYCVEE